MITDEMLTTYALPVLLTGLMLYMAFIVYRLGMDSKSGKWGMFVLFIGLMVGSGLWTQIRCQNLYGIFAGLISATR